MKRKPRGPARDRVISIRVTEQEHAELEHWARISGVSLSDYLRGKGRPSIVQTGTASSPTWVVQV